MVATLALLNIISNNPLVQFVFPVCAFLPYSVSVVLFPEGIREHISEDTLKFFLKLK